MKKVLITGANGLLGQKLVQLLSSDTEYTVLATARGERRIPLENKVNYQKLDVTDKSAVQDVITSFMPDVVVHTAAMTNVDACEDEQEACDLLNVQSVAFIADVLKGTATQLIHISTDFIFDGLKGPYAEDAEANALSVYGQSKLDSEKVLMNSGIHYCVLRTILVYGILPDLSRSNFILWSKSNLEKGASINVVDDQFRSPTLAEDLAMACKLAMDNSAEGIFNISGPETFSILDLVKIVADHWDLDKSLIGTVSTAELGQKAHRPSRTGFVLDKAMNELSFKPTPFKESLSLIEEQLNHVNQTSK